MHCNRSEIINWIFRLKNILKAIKTMLIKKFQAKALRTIKKNE